MKYDQKAIRELRFGLNPSALHLIGGCKNAKEIWKKLEEMYTADEQVDATQSCLVMEFASFRQKPEETIDETASRFYELLSVMEKYDVSRTLID